MNTIDQFLFKNSQFTNYFVIQSGPGWQDKAPNFKVLVHNPEKRVKLGGVSEYTIFHVTSLVNK